MKKYIYASFICIVILCIAYIASFQIIPQSNSYSIVNELGEPIEATLYERTNKENKELLLIVDDAKVRNVIVLIPHLELIALAEGGRKEFVKINFMSSLWQRSKTADHSMIINNLINNHIIEFYSFSEDKIVFNSFGEFSQFGKKIIINKL